MAVSGSKNYSITRSDIINAALRKIGEYDQGESPSGDEVNAASLALNLMVKEWVADGADLWLRQELTLFLQKDQKKYLLGQTDHLTTSFVETTLSSAYAASSTTLDVGSTTGMTAADNIGIKLDSNTIHWTTISSVDDADTVTIASGLASAAASGNKVYAYTTRATRPHKLVYAFRRDTGNIDTEVSLVGENEYRRQSNKGSSGPPVEVWYNPKLDAGELHVWPVDGGKSFDKLILIGQYYPDDFDAQANNPQFPIEWGNALVWGLAAELSSEYGIPEREQGRLWQISQYKLDKVLDHDVENASVIFGMRR